MNEPQPIPMEYKQAGHCMRLVRRQGMAAMYMSAGEDYWEVHRVRVAPAKEIFGKAYPEREILASNEDFGTWGWACISQDRANRRFADAVATNAMISSDVTPT